MIRITKLPYIKEDTDKLGNPLGTFSVVDIQGEIEEDTWVKIQEYEGYHLSEGARQDEALIKPYLYKSILNGSFDANNLPQLPYMRKVIGYPGIEHLMWLFNLRTSVSGSQSEYVRSYAVFGDITLHVWTPEHDEKVKFLKDEAARMNNK